MTDSIYQQLQCCTVDSHLTDAPNSGLTRYSGHSSMYELIYLCYNTKKNSRLTDSLVSGQRTIQSAPSNVDPYK